MQNLGRNLFVSEDGCKALGKFVRDYRTSLSPEMRLEDLEKEIIKETGYETCSISTLSKFENGKHRFNTDLCAAIAAVLQIKNPLQERFYDGRDFDEVARENLDLSTGLPPKKKRSK
jgi:transcriptional regulator with XRE-family HTH domain